MDRRAMHLAEQSDSNILNNIFKGDIKVNKLSDKGAKQVLNILLEENHINTPDKEQYHGKQKKTTPKDDKSKGKIGRK